MLMAARTPTVSNRHPRRTHDDPIVSVCESCPGKFVFLESGNADGWIATDLTIVLDQ